MTQPTEHRELLDADEAAGLLTVTVDRIEAMVEEGLLSPDPASDTLRFHRSEVEAVRGLGG